MHSTTRRQWLLRGLPVIAVASSGWFCGRAGADDDPPGTPTPTPGVTVADLEQQLKSGLKARRQLEFDFIHYVTLRVKNNQLPIDIVQSTFLWARRRQPYPYPYFERGLRERAAKAGFPLD